MRILELNQMEQIEGGLSRCEWGMTLATVFVGGAFTLATAGIGSFFVGAIFGVGGALATEAVCQR
mgnify:FL=1